MTISLRIIGQKNADKKKNYDTENLIKIFELKTNFILHNASNDCIVLYKSLRKLIKISPPSLVHFFQNN